MSECLTAFTHPCEEIACELWEKKVPTDTGCNCECDSTSIHKRPCPDGTEVNAACQCANIQCFGITCDDERFHVDVTSDACECICTNPDTFTCPEGSTTEPGSCECKSCLPDVTGTLEYQCAGEFTGSGTFVVLRDTAVYSSEHGRCTHVRKINGEIATAGSVVVCGSTLTTEITCPNCATIQTSLTIQDQTKCCNAERFNCTTEDGCISDNFEGTGTYASLRECYGQEGCNPCQRVEYSGCQVCNIVDGKAVVTDKCANSKDPVTGFTQCCDAVTLRCKSVLTQCVDPEDGSLGLLGFSTVESGVCLCNSLGIDIPDIEVKYRCTGNSGDGSSFTACLPDALGTYNSAEECYRLSNCIDPN